MKRNALWGLLLLFVACNNNSKPLASFETASGLGVFNEYNAIIQLPKGDYLAGGYSIINDDPNLPELPSQAIVAHYNEAGDLVNTQPVGQSTVDNIITGVLLQSGDVVFAGTSKSERGDMDVLIVKCNNRGEVIWTWVYGGRVGEEVYDIEETFDGKLVITGATGSSALFSEEERHGFIWFLSSEGQVEGEYTVDLGKESILKDISLLGKTGYFAVGEYTDSLDVFHPLFVSYQDDTIMEFADTIPGEAIGLISVAADSFYVFGTDSRTGTLVQWQMNGLGAGFTRRPVHDAVDMELEEIRRYYDGGYVLAANRSEEGAMYYGMIVQVYDGNGALLWSKELKGDKTQMLRSIAVTADSGVVVAGFKDIESKGSQAYIVKLDSKGELK